MASPRRFGPHLAELLEGRELSQRAFARQARVNQAWVGKVIRGERRPPLESMEEWMGILGVRGRSDREAFRELAHLEHTTEWLRERYWALKEKGKRARIR